MPSGVEYLGVDLLQGQDMLNQETVAYISWSLRWVARSLRSWLVRPAGQFRCVDIVRRAMEDARGLWWVDMVKRDGGSTTTRKWRSIFAQQITSYCYGHYCWGISQKKPLRLWSLALRRLRTPWSTRRMGSNTRASQRGLKWNWSWSSWWVCNVWA